MSDPFYRLVLELLWAFEQKAGEGFEPDEVLSWMAEIGASIDDLTPEERVAFAAQARRLADDAAGRGDDDAAAAYARIADVEEARA